MQVQQIQTQEDETQEDETQEVRPSGSHFNTLSVGVAARFNPFEAGLDAGFEAIPGQSLSELIALCNPPDWFELTGHVVIQTYDGVSHEIDKNLWPNVRPKGGTRVAIYCLPLGGGGTGGAKKDVLTTVASLALLAGSLAIPFFGLPFLGSGFAAGAWGAKGIGLLLGVAGLFVKSLAPPPPPKNLGDVAELPSTAGVTQNALRRGTQISAVLGTMQTSPQYLANPYTSFEDGYTFSHAIVGCWGHYSVSEIKINNTDIALIPNLELEQRFGLDTDQPITVAPLSVTEDQSIGQLSEFKISRSATSELKEQSIPTSNYPIYHNATTQPETDRVIFRILFPGGIAKGSNQVTVPFHFSYREIGSSTWINGPEIHFTDPDHTTKEIRQQVRVLFGERAPNYAPTTDTNNYVLRILGSCGNAAWSWVPDARFVAGAGQVAALSAAITDEGVDIFIENGVRGQYEFQMQRGLAFQNQYFNPSTYTYNGTVNARFFDCNVTKNPVTVPADQRDVVSAMGCEVFQSIRDDYPIRAKGLTLIAIKARGLRLETISAKFASWAPIWDGTSWGAEAPTKNPSGLFLKVLRDYNLITGNMPDEIIDLAKLGAWFDFCVGNNLTCNAALDQGSLAEVLMMIAAAGWAVVQHSQKWAVIFEHDRSAETPQQLLTPLTTTGVTITREFDEIPHALCAEFLDAARGYKSRDDVIVYSPGYNAENATDLETLSYKGIDNEPQARGRLALDLGQMLYRQKSYAFDQFIENLVSGRGDLVEFSHPALGTRFGFSKLRSVVSAGGFISALQLDDTVEIVAGPGDLFSMGNLFAAGDLFADNAASAVAIRLNDKTSITLNITQTAGVWSTLTLATPIADEGKMGPGAIVAVGRRGLTTRRCVIFDIRRRDFRRARVTLVDEAKELHAA